MSSSIIPPPHSPSVNPLAPLTPLTLLVNPEPIVGSEALPLPVEEGTRPEHRRTPQNAFIEALIKKKLFNQNGRWIGGEKELPDIPDPLKEYIAIKLSQSLTLVEGQKGLFDPLAFLQSFSRQDFAYFTVSQALVTGSALYQFIKLKYKFKEGEKELETSYFELCMEAFGVPVELLTEELLEQFPEYAMDLDARITGSFKSLDPWTSFEKLIEDIESQVEKSIGYKGKKNDLGHTDLLTHHIIVNGPKSKKAPDKRQCLSTLEIGVEGEESFELVLDNKIPQPHKSFFDALVLVVTGDSKNWRFARASRLLSKEGTQAVFDLSTKVIDLQFSKNLNNRCLLSFFQKMGEWTVEGTLEQMASLLPKTALFKDRLKSVIKKHCPKEHIDFAYAMLIHLQFFQSIRPYPRDLEKTILPFSEMVDILESMQVFKEEGGEKKELKQQEPSKPVQHLKTLLMEADEAFTQDLFILLEIAAFSAIHRENSPLRWTQNFREPAFFWPFFKTKKGKPTPGLVFPFSLDTIGAEALTSCIQRLEESYRRGSKEHQAALEGLWKHLCPNSGLFGQKRPFTAKNVLYSLMNTCLRSRHHCSSALGDRCFLQIKDQLDLQDWKSLGSNYPEFFSRKWAEPEIRQLVIKNKQLFDLFKLLANTLTIEKFRRLNGFWDDLPRPFIEKFALWMRKNKKGHTVEWVLQREGWLNTLNTEELLDWAQWLVYDQAGLDEKSPQLINWLTPLFGGAEEAHKVQERARWIQLYPQLFLEGLDLLDVQPRDSDFHRNCTEALVFYYDHLHEPRRDFYTKPNSKLQKAWEYYHEGKELAQHKFKLALKREADQFDPFELISSLKAMKQPTVEHWQSLVHSALQMENQEKKKKVLLFLSRHLSFRLGGEFYPPEQLSRDLAKLMTQVPQMCVFFPDKWVLHLASFCSKETLVDFVLHCPSQQIQQRPTLLQQLLVCAVCCIGDAREIYPGLSPIGEKQRGRWEDLSDAFKKAPLKRKKWSARAFVQWILTRDLCLRKCWKEVSSDQLKRLKFYLGAMEKQEDWTFFSSLLDAFKKEPTLLDALVAFSEDYERFPKLWKALSDSTLSSEQLDLLVDKARARLNKKAASPNEVKDIFILFKAHPAHLHSLAQKTNLYHLVNHSTLAPFILELIESYMQLAIEKLRPIARDPLYMSDNGVSLVGFLNKRPLEKNTELISFLLVIYSECFELGFNLVKQYVKSNTDKNLVKSFCLDSERNKKLFRFFDRNLREDDNSLFDDFVHFLWDESEEILDQLIEVYFSEEEKSNQLVAFLFKQDKKTEIAFLHTRLNPRLWNVFYKSYLQQLTSPDEKSHLINEELNAFEWRLFKEANHESNRALMYSLEHLLSLGPDSAQTSLLMDFTLTLLIEAKEQVNKEHWSGLLKWVSSIPSLGLSKDVVDLAYRNCPIEIIEGEDNMQQFIFWASLIEKVEHFPEKMIEDLKNKNKEIFNCAEGEDEEINRLYLLMFNFLAKNIVGVKAAIPAGTLSSEVLGSPPSSIEGLPVNSPGSKDEFCEELPSEFANESPSTFSTSEGCSPAGTADVKDKKSRIFNNIHLFTRFFQFSKDATLHKYVFSKKIKRNFEYLCDYYSSLIYLYIRLFTFLDEDIMISKSECLLKINQLKKQEKIEEFKILIECCNSFEGCLSFRSGELDEVLSSFIEQEKPFQAKKLENRPQDLQLEKNLDTYLTRMILETRDVLKRASELIYWDALIVCKVLLKSRSDQTTFNIMSLLVQRTLLFCVESKIDYGVLNACEFKYTEETTAEEHLYLFKELIEKDKEVTYLAATHTLCDAVRALKKLKPKEAEELIFRYSESIQKVSQGAANYLSKRVCDQLMELWDLCCNQEKCAFSLPGINKKLLISHISGHLNLFTALIEKDATALIEKDAEVSYITAIYTLCDALRLLKKLKPEEAKKLTLTYKDQLEEFGKGVAKYYSGKMCDKLIEAWDLCYDQGRLKLYLPGIDGSLLALLAAEAAFQKDYGKTTCIMKRFGERACALTEKQGKNGKKQLPGEFIRDETLPDLYIALYTAVHSVNLMSFPENEKIRLNKLFNSILRVENYKESLLFQWLSKRFAKESKDKIAEILFIATEQVLSFDLSDDQKYTFMIFEFFAFNIILDLYSINKISESLKVQLVTKFSQVLKQHILLMDDLQLFNEWKDVFHKMNKLGAYTFTPIYTEDKGKSLSIDSDSQKSLPEKSSQLINSPFKIDLTTSAEVVIDPDNEKAFACIILEISEPKFSFNSNYLEDYVTLLYLSPHEIHAKRALIIFNKYAPQILEKSLEEQEGKVVLGVVNATLAPLVDAFNTLCKRGKCEKMHTVEQRYSHLHSLLEGLKVLNTHMQKLNFIEITSYFVAMPRDLLKEALELKSDEKKLKEGLLDRLLDQLILLMAENTYKLAKEVCLKQNTNVLEFNLSCISVEPIKCVGLLKEYPVLAEKYINGFLPTFDFLTTPQLVGEQVIIDKSFITRLELMKNICMNMSLTIQENKKLSNCKYLVKILSDRTLKVAEQVETFLQK